ncbi:MAG: UDP-3-O-(3-hydroxymyristoyl)glucosamine N-acyltransferase [Desulfobacterales bacterium]|jgi:UDP-3-O-[3-hydroxymyristoyl] glucosamine N-acyltransferase
MEIPLKRLAEHVGGHVKGDGDTVICGVAPFETAAVDEITFADGPKFIKRLHQCTAGAVIVPEETDEGTSNLLHAANPKAAFARIIALFHPPAVSFEGISPRAVLGKGFRGGKDIAVAASVTIGNGVCIGDRVVLHPGVVLGDDVSIGNDTIVYPNVTILDRCRIGSRVIIQAGTVIGSDGYGFAPDGGTHVKIPHLGIVQIDDDVEIGAVNTIDRATFGKTWIQKGVKTDNLVQIAHNVTIGENTLIVAQVGIAGSTTIGRHVILAAKAGIAGHLSLGDNSIIGPMTGIGKSVEPGQILSGTLGGIPHRQWLRMQRVVPELPELKKRLVALEKEVARLSGKAE